MCLTTVTDFLKFRVYASLTLFCKGAPLKNGCSCLEGVGFFSEARRDTEMEDQEELPGETTKHAINSTVGRAGLGHDPHKVGCHQPHRLPVYTDGQGRQEGGSSDGVWVGGRISSLRLLAGTVIHQPRITLDQSCRVALLRMGSDRPETVLQSTHSKVPPTKSWVSA